MPARKPSKKQPAPKPVGTFPTDAKPEKLDQLEYGRKVAASHAAALKAGAGTVPDMEPTLLDPSLMTGRCRCLYCKANPTPVQTAKPAKPANPSKASAAPNAEATTPAPTPKPGQTPLATLLSKSIAQVSGKELDSSPHMIIEARAGTGKTTTLVEGLKVVKGLPTRITPSPQQKAVWDCLALSAGAQSICFVAFNRSIAEELKTRVPQGCEAMTMHSLGLKAVTKAFGRVECNSYVVPDLISELLQRDIRELRTHKPVLLKATEELVSLCKMNLVDPSQPEALAELAAYYEVDTNGSRDEIFALVPRVLEACKQPKGRINFDDMIWLPIILDLPMFKYDLLLVDEAQDLNRCQQALAMKAGSRLVLCGDPRQAIYGFAGADSKAMERKEEFLKATPRGCVHLPITVTRRCGKAIVAEACKYVPDFEAHADNGPGKVSEAAYPTDKDGKERKDNYTGLAADGDMVLCRVNAPLVSQCFRFLKAGRKAQIQGRDIGQGLISTIKKMKANGIIDLTAKLDDWSDKELKKERAKKFPNEARMIMVTDRMDCLACFIAGCDTVDEVIRKIESVFTDDKSSPGIKLSSIHKAKGLEAKRVFFLRPKGGECPHPMAKSAWQKDQELNLCYVAITRAIEELVYVY